MENEAGDMCLSQNLQQGQSDLSLLWYVSSPDGAFSTFDHITGSVFGDHQSQDKQYWLSIEDSVDNKSAVYTDGLGNFYDYNSTYFSALSVDEFD